MLAASLLPAAFSSRPVPRFTIEDPDPSKLVWVERMPVASYMDNKYMDPSMSGTEVMIGYLSVPLSYVVR